MNIIEYVPLAVRTEKVLPTMNRLVHGCMGLITEIGEVTTELKRMAIYGKPLDAERKANLLEEVGDVMWYIAIILDALGADLTYMDLAPKMDMPDEQEGKYESLALVLGMHCGMVCYTTQSFIVENTVDNEQIPHYLASLAMLINAVYVLALFCDSTLEQAMEDNIAKLRVRFPNAYTNEAAEARADKNGADARNS
jgi:NTP pyrophosphatase (non-canonical NTP hydrolase)